MAGAAQTTVHPDQTSGDRIGRRNGLPLLIGTENGSMRTGSRSCSCCRRPRKLRYVMLQARKTHMVRRSMTSRRNWVSKSRKMVNSHCDCHIPTKFTFCEFAAECPRTCERVNEWRKRRSTDCKTFGRVGRKTMLIASQKARGTNRSRIGCRGWKLHRSDYRSATRPSRLGRRGSRRPPILCG